MKKSQEQRKQLVHAGIWSLAVLALLAVGMVTMFSSASRRTKDKLPQTDTTAALTEEQTGSVNTEETDEDAGYYPPANPLDTDVADVDASPSDIPQNDHADDLPTASFDNGDDFHAIVPVAGEIAKAFTEDVAVYSLTMNDYRVHSGIDITAPVGTAVGACAAGVIERVWSDPFLGQCVEINHGGNIRSQYANLSPDLPRGIEPGATVLAGDVIGGVGETMIIEMADSDHLHFSMTVDGVYVDPTEYMN